MQVADLVEKLLSAASAFISFIENEGIDEDQLQEAYEVRWMKPTGPRSSSQHTETRDELSYVVLHRLYDAALKQELKPLAVLHEAAAEFHREQGNSVIGLGDSLAEESGKKLLLNFFLLRGELHTDPNLAARICKEFIDDLSVSTALVRSVYEVGHFSACRDFALLDDIDFRSVSDDDIDEIGRLMPWSYVTGRPPIDGRSWICEITFPIPKENPQEICEHRSRCEQVAGALSLTSPGHVVFHHLQTQVASPFLAAPIYGPGAAAICSSAMGDEVSLDESAIGEFAKRYVQIRKADTEQSLNYLRLPIRRMRLASQRSTPDDRLVDYVIALESLLANDSERLETTFRFKLRGAALIPVGDFGDAVSRLKLMKELYDLRSAVVHGSAKEAKVREILPTAENVCRSVVLWFLDHHDKDRGVRALLKILDESLVNGGANWAWPHQ